MHDLHIICPVFFGIAYALAGLSKSLHFLHRAAPGAYILPAFQALIFFMKEFYSSLRDRQAFKSLIHYAD